MESVWRHQFSSLKADFQLDLGVDFFWSITTHGFTLIQTIYRSHCKIAVTMQEDKHTSKSRVFPEFPCNYGSFIYLLITSEQHPCLCWRKAFQQHDAANIMFLWQGCFFTVICFVRFLIESSRQSSILVVTDLDNLLLLVCSVSISDMFCCISWSSWWCIFSQNIYFYTVITLGTGHFYSLVRRFLKTGYMDFIRLLSIWEK